MNWDSFCLYAEVLVAAMIAANKLQQTYNIFHTILLLFFFSSLSLCWNYHEYHENIATKIALRIITNW